MSRLRNRAIVTFRDVVRLWLVCGSDGLANAVDGETLVNGVVAAFAIILCVEAGWRTAVELGHVS